MAHIVLYTADLHGSSEVPPSTSTATGVAFLLLDVDTGRMDYTVVSTGFGDAPNAVVAAHIHLGGPTVAGSIQFPLVVNSSGNGSGFIQLTQAELADFLRTDHYVNLHTAQFPDGAIRGQMALNPRALVYRASLSGSRENPPTTTTATGTAYVFLDNDSNKLAYWAVATGFGASPNNVVASHIHTGGARVNAPPRIPTPVDATGNGSGIVIVTDAQRTILLQNELYFNEHTTQFPGGAIRGQLEAELGPALEYVFNQNALSGTRQFGVGRAASSIINSETLASRTLFELIDAALSLGPPQTTITPSFDAGEFPNGPLRVRIVTRPVTIPTQTEFFVSPGIVSSASALPAGISQPDFRNLYFQDYTVSINDLDVNQTAAVPFLFGPVVVGGPQLGDPAGSSFSVTAYNIVFEIDTPGDYVLGVRWKVGKSSRGSGPDGSNLEAAEVNVAVPVTVTGTRPTPPYLTTEGQVTGSMVSSQIKLDEVIRQAIDDYAAAAAAGPKSRRH